MCHIAFIHFLISILPNYILRNLLNNLSLPEQFPLPQMESHRQPQELAKLRQNSFKIRPSIQKEPQGNFIIYYQQNMSDPSDNVIVYMCIYMGKKNLISESLLQIE